MPGVVLVLEDDLLFASRVEIGLRANGFHPHFVTRLSNMSEALKVAPVLILTNLGSRMPWARMVYLAKKRRTVPRPAVVGYGPRADLGLRHKALQAGCDVLVGRSAIIDSIDSLLHRYVWKPDLSTGHDPLPAGVLKGIDQFNTGEYYECHDSIELEWVAERGDVRLLYQGLLQISVAFFHVRRGNWRGMVKMLTRGRGKLLPFQPECMGIDVTQFLKDVEQCEAGMRELGPSRLLELDRFPAIRVNL